VPTAVQKLADAQETPNSSSSLVLGLGLLAIDQVLPFHVSIRV
jgi:hypothetical protein